MKSDQRALLETLAYFEQFKRALKPGELHQLVWKESFSGEQFKKALNNLVQQNIVYQDVYIGLSDQTVAETKKRQKLLEERRHKALRMAEVIYRAPGVASVILMNSTAMQTLTEASDIDFLIITEPNALYIARTFVIAQLEWLGLMKSAKQQAGKACLGYWLSSDDLNVRLYQHEMRTASYWVATMVPLAGIAGYQQLIKANNWAGNFLPNWTPHEVAHLRERESRIWNLEFSKKITKLANRVLFPVHRFKVLRDPELGRSDELVCTPNRLKLHSIDNRPQYLERMQSILDIVLAKR